jgi:AAHS family 3-hydroxyphenylpropionic acid transporter
MHGARLAMLIAICVTISFLEGFDLHSISIAAPMLVAELGLDKNQTGQVFASGQAGLVVGALLGGWGGDRLGRRHMLMIGTIAFGIFCTSTVIAGSFWTVMIARTLTGAGIGLVMPNLISLAAECAPEKHRGKTVAIILAGMPFGGMTVALLGSAFLESWGWRSLFYIGGLLPLAVAPLILLLPSYRPARAAARKLDIPHALFGEGRAAATGLLWFSLLMTAAIVYMMVNWLPSVLIDRGYSIRVAHLASAMFSLGGATGSFTLGFFIDRFGYRRVLPPLYLGVICAAMGTTFFNAELGILFSSLMLGFFATGSFYSLNGSAPLYYPAQSRGLGTGAAVGLGRMGSVLGPLIAGYFLQHGFGPVPAGPGVIPAVVVPVALLALVGAVFLTRRIHSMSLADPTPAASVPAHGSLAKDLS